MSPEGPFSREEEQEKQSGWLAAFCNERPPAEVYY
jgi:hypothetical protein